MTLNDLLEAINGLSPEELQRVREHLAQIEKTLVASDPSALDHALAALQDGLSNDYLDRIEWAMNVEG